MLRHGASVDQVAREFAVRWSYRPRQAWRYAHGLTQDEVASRYNELIGEPNAPMTGKRICDYEAWPHGGVKPTLKSLSVLAEIYRTRLSELIDFSDSEAMSEAERIAAKASAAAPPSPRLPDRHTAESGAAIPQVRGAPPLSDMLELMFNAYSGYLTSCLEITRRSTYTAREVERLLVVLNNVIKKLVCADAGWIDVMVPIGRFDPAASVPLISGVDSGGGWLTVLYSGVRRTSRPTVVPIEINGTPWRGSANALVSRGIDYVGSFKGLYGSPEYGLPQDVLEAVEAKYDYWRRECYFAALLAVGINPPGDDTAESIGVLNLNFEYENPIGTGDTLDPQSSIDLLNILEPALQVLATAIVKHNERKRGPS